MVCFALSLIILSNIFPKLLETVMPLSFEHFPLIPLPLYILVTDPSCHSIGIFWDCSMVFNVCRYRSRVGRVALMKASLGMSSGPQLFAGFSFFIAWFSSCSVIGVCGWLCCLSISHSFTLVMMVSVRVLLSWSASLAWYSCSK